MALEALQDAESAAEVPVENEDGLLLRVRSGDLRAFETLYRRHCGAIHGLALRLTCRSAEAEDLTQEAFLKALQHRADFASAAHLHNWLRRVTVNTWLNRVRQKHPLQFEDGRAPSDAEDTRGFAPADPGLRLDLERALAALPVRQRSLVVLFDVYGWHHEEIGELLGIQAASSKVMLHHARRRLREMLR